MREYVKTILNIILATLPVVSLILFALSVGALGISLNPDVKWNEYSTESYGYYLYYFNTLWSSLDGFSYATINGQYQQVLTREKINGTKIFVHDESWKIPIRTELYKGIGLVAGSLLILTVAPAVHAVTKQKLFTTLLLIIALGLALSGGVFTQQSIGKYKGGIIEGILPTRKVTKEYKPDKEIMRLGYNLATYSAIMTFLGCGLIIVNVGLFIPFGNGKWIWEKNTIGNSNQQKTTPLQSDEMQSADNNTVMTSLPPSKQSVSGGRKKESTIVTVQEVNKTDVS